MKAVTCNEWAIYVIMRGFRRMALCRPAEIHPAEANTTAEKVRVFTGKATKHILICYLHGTW